MKLSIGDTTSVGARVSPWPSLWSPKTTSGTPPACPQADARAEVLWGRRPVNVQKRRPSGHALFGLYVYRYIYCVCLCCQCYIYYHCRFVYAHVVRIGQKPLVGPEPVAPQVKGRKRRDHAILIPRISPLGAQRQELLEGQRRVLVVDTEVRVEARGEAGGRAPVGVVLMVYMYVGFNVDRTHVLYV